MITISLCMIVKNEEAVLERCLKSVGDIADEIVIVDTGSTDGTKEIWFAILPGGTILPLRGTIPFPRRPRSTSYGWMQTIFSPTKTGNPFCS